MNAPPPAGAPRPLHEEVALAREALLARAQTATLSQLLTATLDEAERLTGSTIGFFHFVDEDQRALTLQAWSTNTTAKMCTAEGAGRHYPVSDAGVWADCIRLNRPVIHNDYPGLQDKRGMPAGHAPVLRQVSVPLAHGGRIGAVIGLGNKPTAYEQRDVEIILALGAVGYELAAPRREAAQRALEPRREPTAAGTRIVRREVFSDTTFLWEVHAPEVASVAEPGHFVMVRVKEGGERIPLTVADFDRQRGTVTLVVQALGKTTREMMTDFAEGDRFLDFVGPLGQPQHIEKVGHVVVVGGGLGVAPVFPQLRAFRQVGNRTTAILGFRSKEQVFWEQRFAAFAGDLTVCTDDGSYGEKGLVTQPLKALLERERPDLIVAIGPLPMMQACVEVTRPFQVKTMVSLNAIMVDGTGMCGSCRVSVGGQVRFACVDGPDFDGHQVDFKELTARQKRFVPQEREANQDLAHVCNLEKQLFTDAKRNYKKLKELAPHQTKMPERDAVERARNFKEVNLGYSLADALAEAERCIQCVKPTCIAGCPVAVDIPRFIRHLLVRDLEGARGVITEANAFPSICGRVCPQESQCEAQCIIGKKMEPVAIGRLERFVGDGPGAQEPPPRLDGRKRVAIVGGGPSGLACAADLARAGVTVTVFEALHVAGGVLQYGIPSFRLPREVIAREVDALVRLGVTIETNKVVGKTFTVAQLLGERGFDAVFLGVGAGAPSFLGIPGEQAGQVFSANEFLTRVNLMGGDRFPYRDTPVGLGSSVVVVGAGNTAMDCLRVARRLTLAREEHGGPKSVVRCVYRRSEAEAPARVEELRHAKEEGIEFFFLHSPVEILVDAQGVVRGVRLEKMRLGEPDAKGRKKPLPTGEFVELPCDTVISALGSQANPIVTRSTAGLTLNKWGYIVADEVLQTTSVPGVFAGGDIVTGGATVILAMGAGRRAARAISTYLDHGKRWPPTREQVSAFSVAPKVMSCPKCRRPVEGGEAYVCCAAAQLQWRCQGCGKVSEGFAFPWGLCPACGGVLEVRDEARSRETLALEPIRRAFEIELGGRAFYRRAAQDARDPALHELFGQLEQMENAHMATLARRYHTGEPPPQDVTASSAALYAGVELVPTDPAGLLRVAIGFEQRAVRFFDEALAKSASGSAEAVLYQELGAEEREHVAMLETELARFLKDKPGLL